MPDDIRDVFISYHEASAGKLTEKIAAELESAGISCWYAKRDLPPGGDFAQCIQRQLNGCKAFLLVLNQGSAESDFVRNELGIAFNRRDKRKDLEIIPFRVEDCATERIDFFLNSIQIIDAFGRPEARLQGLTEEIARKLGRELRDKDAERRAEMERVITRTRDFLENELSLDADKTTYLLNALARTYQPDAPQTRMPFFIPLSTRSVDSGTLGNLRWTLESEGCLTISGRGRMKDMDCSDYSAWRAYDMISSVIIKPGVTGIGNYAFYRFQRLWGVSIPDSVASIGKCAFYACYSLRSVAIPDGVSSIGAEAFRDCYNLKILAIPDGVSSIGAEAFRDCSELERVSIPKSVVSIGKGAFYRCKSLREVSMLNPEARIDDYAFEDCGRNCNEFRVFIPRGKSVSSGAFPPWAKYTECDFDADGTPIL